MANYKTPDGVKVKAEKSPAEGGDENSSIWEITFPDGEVRYMHDSIFPDNFKKV